MALTAAFEKAMKDMQRIRPYVVASKSGSPYYEGKFTLPFFDRTFLAYYPEVRVEELGVASPPPEAMQILLLHYLLKADGAAVVGHWIAYRELPGANLFDSRFQGRATAPLLQAFGDDIEAFVKAGQSLGGTPMSRLGDAAFRFLALPKIPMACVLYRGDEEFPSSATILFDAAAPHYLPTEDLSYVGMYLSTALARRKASPT